MSVQNLTLAQEVFRLVSDRFAEEGIGPDHPEMLEVLATMIAAHFVLRGGGGATFSEVLTLVGKRCIYAQHHLEEMTFPEEVGRA